MKIKKNTLYGEMHDPLNVRREMTEYEKWQYKRAKRGEVMAWICAVPGLIVAIIMMWRIWNGM